MPQRDRDKPGEGGDPATSAPQIKVPDQVQRLWQFILAQVSLASGQPDDTAETVALWAFLHGFAELERSGLYGLSGPGAGFERGLAALLSWQEPADTTLSN